MNLINFTMNLINSVTDLNPFAADLVNSTMDPNRFAVNLNNSMTDLNRFTVEYALYGVVCGVKPPKTGKPTLYLGGGSYQNGQTVT
ncbi:MAG: hypothetical protein LBD31_01545 [Treponema sp.]|nr:hypothetical protein [Treponema sp.]